MHGSENPEGPRDADDPDRLVIAVVRSGGLAGLRRRWRAVPEPEHAPEWMTLVEQCPWDEQFDDAPGADRYVWSIHARVHAQQLQQVVPDAHLQGAWRDLVDAVREADPSDE